MERHIASGVVAVSIAAGSSAYAADLSLPPPQRPPAPAVVLAPAWSWTGLYAGGFVGYGFGKTDWKNFQASSLVQSENGPDVNGLVYGGQIGYNYQFGWTVWGIQFDGALSDVRGAGSIVEAGTPVHADSRTQWLTSLTGRLGAIVYQDTLLYVKGGAAWANFKRNAYWLSGGEERDTRSGGTIGIGAEYHFAPNWSLFVEGNYYDFGRKTVTIPQGSTSLSFDAKDTLSDVKIGFNYKFW